MIGVGIFEAALFWFFSKTTRDERKTKPNPDVVKEFDFSYQQQKSCLDIRNWAAFWLKRGKKKEKPLGNFLNYLVGSNVRKESRAPLCKLGS